MLNTRNVSRIKIYTILDLDKRNDGVPNGLVRCSDWVMAYEFLKRFRMYLQSYLAWLIK